MTQPVSPGDPMEIVASEWNEVRRRVLPASGIGIGSGGWITEVLLAKVGNGGIPARSGTTVGSATVTVYTVDDSDILTATDRTVVVKNTSESDIPEDTWIIIASEFTRRSYVVVNLASECAITDLRLDGNNLQYYKCGAWFTWHTGSDCPSGS